MKSGEIKARVEKSIQMTYDLRRAQTAWHFWTDCSSQPPGNMRHTGITDSHISSKIMKNLYKKKEAVSCLSQKGIMEIPHLFTSIKSRTGNTSLTRNPYSPCLRLKCTDTGRDGGQAVMICNIIFIPRTLHFFPLSGIAPILLPWMPLKLSGILFEHRSVSNSHLNTAGRVIKTHVHLRNNSNTMMTTNLQSIILVVAFVATLL